MAAAAATMADAAAIRSAAVASAADADYWLDICPRMVSSLPDIHVPARYSPNAAARFLIFRILSLSLGHPVLD